MMPFVLIGAIGVVILVLSVVLDGLADGLHLFDVLDGAFSTMAVGSGLTIIGAVGIATEQLGPAITWPIALVSGVIAWLVVARLIRWLRRNSSAPVGSSVNAKGVALCAMSPLGEVQLLGDINKRLARCEGPSLEAGTPIRVIDIDGPYLVVIRDESPAPTKESSWPQLPQGK